MTRRWTAKMFTARALKQQRNWSWGRLERLWNSSLEGSTGMSEGSLGVFLFSRPWFRCQNMLIRPCFLERVLANSPVFKKKYVSSSILWLHSSYVCLNTNSELIYSCILEACSVFLFFWALQWNVERGPRESNVEAGHTNIHIPWLM